MRLLLENLPVSLQPQRDALAKCLEAMDKALPLTAVYLFGSHARGEARADSDVDLCLVAEGATEQLKAAQRFRGAISEIRPKPPFSLLPIAGDGEGPCEAGWELRTDPAAPLRYDAFIMKTERFLCMLALAAIGGAGCMTANDHRFDKHLQAWVPVGTPAEEARTTLTNKGFKCTLEHRPIEDPTRDRLVCKRENAFMNRTWLVILPLDDGKVAGMQRAISHDFFRVTPSH